MVLFLSGQLTPNIRLVSNSCKTGDMSLLMKFNGLKKLLKEKLLKATDIIYNMQKNLV